MALPNNGLYILGPLSCIGRLLGRALSDRCALQYTAHELKAPDFTPAPDTYLNYECEKNRLSAELGVIREELTKIQPSLEHCTAAPRLKQPMIDLYLRLLHLINHNTVDRSRPQVDKLLQGDLPPLSADVRALQQFVRALENASEVYSTLARARAAYLDVQHQQRFLLESYKEMEAKFIIGSGTVAESRNLSATISSDEERYTAFRVKHVRIVLESIPYMREISSLRDSVEDVNANPQVNEFAVPFHLENWMALCALSVDLRLRIHNALMAARKDVGEYHPQEKNPELEEYRRERTLHRNSLLGKIDASVFELLKTPA